METYPPNVVTGSGRSNLKFEILVDCIHGLEVAKFGKTPAFTMQYVVLTFETIYTELTDTHFAGVEISG